MRSYPLLAQHLSTSVQQLYHCCRICSGNIQQNGSVFIQFFHLHGLFHLIGMQTIHSLKGHRVYRQLIFLFGLPLRQYLILARQHRIRDKQKRNFFPQAVFLYFHVNGCRVNARHRLIERQIYISIKVESRRSIHIQRKELGGLRFNLFSFLFFLFAFLFLLFGCFRLQFLPLRTSQLICQKKRISLRNKTVQRIRCQVIHLNFERVHLIYQRVFNPIADRVVAVGLLDDKSIPFVKIQSFQCGKRIRPRTESKNKMILFVTFTASKVLTVILFLKRSQDNIIRQETDITHTFDGIDGQ